MSEPRLIAGRYRLDRVLGQGAMGQVWLGFDLLIHRMVAIKQVLAAADPTTRERALREAQAAGRMHHQNAVAVFDLVVLDELPWLVMEYVEGGTLADRIEAARALPPHAVADVASQVAAALAAAHRLGIVHRDVKPANVLINTEGTAKLADFGIARMEMEPGLTGSGFFVGTVSYLAPEIVMGAPVTPAADIWSLGATMFAALEGRPVFTGPNSYAVIAALVNQPVPDPTHAGPLHGLLTRMLSRDPAARPSADQVRAELAPLRAAATVTLPVAPPPPAVSAAPPTPPAAPVTEQVPQAPVQVPTEEVPPEPAQVPTAQVPTEQAPTVPASAPPGPGHRPAKRRRRRTILAATAVVVLAAAGTGVGLELSGGGSNAGASGPSTSAAPARTQGSSTDSYTAIGDLPIRKVAWNVTSRSVVVTTTLPTANLNGDSLDVAFNIDGHDENHCHGVDTFYQWTPRTSDVERYTVSSCFRGGQNSGHTRESTHATVEDQGAVVTVTVPRDELGEARSSVGLQVVLNEGVGDSVVPGTGFLAVRTP